MAAHAHTVNTADTARAVSLFLGVPSTHPTILAIASRISLDGLHIAPGTDLSRDPAFHARIFAVGGRELLDIVDPSRRAQLLEHQSQFGPAGARYASLAWGPYGPGHAWSDDRGPGGNAGSSSADYDTVLNNDVGMITAHNFGRSIYGRMGISYATFDELRSQGFLGHHIMRAARDADSLGFRGNHRMVRSLALIHRDDNDPRASVDAMERYNRRLTSSPEMAALLERYRNASPEQRAAITEEIRLLDQRFRQEEGVTRRLDDPANTPGGREGINDGTDEMRTLYFRDHNVDIELRVPAPATVLPSAAIVEPAVVPRSPPPRAREDAVVGDLTAGLEPPSQPPPPRTVVTAEGPTALPPHL